MRTVILLLLALSAGSLRAQELQLPQAQAQANTGAAVPRIPGSWRSPPAAAAVAQVRPESRRIRAIAIGKWVALGGAIAAAGFGYDANRVADSRYQELDRLCQQDPVRCLPRTSGGAYTDPELEHRFQDVRRLDRRATMGLVSAEVGLGAAVGLFLLDLRHGGHEPPDIPYKPPKLEVGPSRSGGMEVGLRLLR